MANDADEMTGPDGQGTEQGTKQDRPAGSGRRRRGRRRGSGQGAAQGQPQGQDQGTAPDGPVVQGQGPGRILGQGQPQGHNRGRGQGAGDSRRGEPQATGAGRQSGDAGAERAGGRGQRPPLPQAPVRRPRRDEEAPERLQPARSRLAPQAPGAARDDHAGRRGDARSRPADAGAAGGIAPGGGTGNVGGRSPQGRPPGGDAGRPDATWRPRFQGEGGRGQQEQAGSRGGRRPDGRGAPLGSVATAPRGRLRVIPLGGVGEVGKNMTAVEYERDLVLLDCGGKFPEEEQRGIDLIIPDVRYVQERLANLRAIVITHGHEDHIGGLPYILPQLKGRAPIPIYGSPLAVGFIERKLAEARLDELVDLHVVQPGDRVQLGALAVEFVHVTHSIPDTNAVAVHSPVGTIIDTADFKFDPTPTMQGPTDERLLRRLGDQGVLALFSDTVRVETAGSTPSERVVLETMDAVIRESRGQVIVTTFASNISRIHMALLAAAKYGRKVAVAGRSMEQNARVALDLGYLDPPEGMLLPLDEVLRLPKNKRVLVITGSQGEAAAALARIAAAEHPKIRVGAGDIVLVSATPIPGNEETVTNTIDNLFRRGTRVVYSAVDRGVHVSGHAGRDELRKMIDLVRPRYAVPIHGEFRHMVLYRELCAEAGIPPERVLLPEIGGVLEFTADSAAHRGRVPAGSILVDRLGDRGNGLVTLRDREHIADDGVIVVTIVVDRESGELIAGPDLVAKGLKPELQNGALREAEQDLRRMLERRSKGEPQLGYMVQRAKEVVGKSLYRRSRSRPMILPVVTEL